MTRLASESLDRDLTSLERFALRSHMFYCFACRRYFRQISLLRLAMRRLAGHVEAGDSMTAQGLPDNVRERIKEAIRRN
jgi:hypothetical protein